MTRNELRRLKSEWAKKLKDSGFDDLENGGFTFRSQSLFAGAYQFLYKADPVKWAAKEEYFRQCRAFLHEFKFRNDFQRRMWELHSEGMSDLKIARQMTTASVKLDRRTVWRRLTPLCMRMLQGREKAAKLRETLKEARAEVARLYEMQRGITRNIKAASKRRAEIMSQIKEVDW